VQCSPCTIWPAACADTAAKDSQPENKYSFAEGDALMFSATCLREMPFAALHSRFLWGQQSTCHFFIRAYSCKFVDKNILCYGYFVTVP
jgi:hypothetical protein